MSTTTEAPADPHDATLAALRSALGVESLRTESFRDNLRVYVEAARIGEALKALQGLGFAQLVELGATDYLGYPERDPKAARFEVHYVVRNLATLETLVVKVGVDDPEPTLPTAINLWMGADWMEREVFDMYGIRFDGHPDLRRILMPDEFTAFPLRKDYPLRGRGERHNFPRITREQS